MGAIVLGVDVETTGISLEKDHVVELAFAAMEVGRWRPLVCGSFLVVPPEFNGMSSEIEALHGIKGEEVARYGVPGATAVAKLLDVAQSYKVDFFVAHNGEGFDKPMLTKVNPKVKDWHWIDSRADVPYPDSFVSRRLVHLAAEHSFLNPFPHNGLSDVLAMLKVLSHYDFDKVLERSRSPWCVVKAVVSYDQRDLAKKRRYSWERLDEQTFYPKTWCKRLKELDLEKEQKEAGFPVERIA